MDICFSLLIIQIIATGCLPTNHAYRPILWWIMWEGPTGGLSDHDLGAAYSDRMIQSLLRLQKQMMGILEKVSERTGNLEKAVVTSIKFGMSSSPVSSNPEEKQRIPPQLSVSRADDFVTKTIFTMCVTVLLCRRLWLWFTCHVLKQCWHILLLHYRSHPALLWVPV